MGGWDRAGGGFVCRDIIKGNRYNSFVAKLLSCYVNLKRGLILFNVAT